MYTFLQFGLLKFKERYDISPTSWHLIKTHNAFKNKEIDEEELIYTIRDHDFHRYAIMDTIEQCTNGIVNPTSPEESKHRLAILGVMKELMGISDVLKSPMTLARLPREIRHRIYHYYLMGHLRNDDFNTRFELSLSPRWPRGSEHLGCVCPFPNPDYIRATRPMGSGYSDVDLALTSKDFRNEVLSYMYSNRLMFFPCPCNMAYHLEANAILRKSIRRVKFVWVGPNSDFAISLLRTIRLQELVVVIEKSTTKNVTKQEEEFRQFFLPKKGANHLTEALGIWELMSLRGIGTVRVENIQGWRAAPRNESDRRNLELLLTSKLTLPRD